MPSGSRTCTKSASPLHRTKFQTAECLQKCLRPMALAASPPMMVYLPLRTDAPLHTPASSSTPSHVGVQDPVFASNAPRSRRRNTTACSARLDYSVAEIPAFSAHETLTTTLDRSRSIEPRRRLSTSGPSVPPVPRPRTGSRRSHSSRTRVSPST